MASNHGDGGESLDDRNNTNSRQNLCTQNKFTVFMDMSKFMLLLRTPCKFTDGWQLC